MLKNSAVTRSDLLAAWGMGLIIVGVAFFLVRDLRRRFEQIDLFLNQLEGRFRYVAFIAPASALLGVFFDTVGARVLMRASVKRSSIAQIMEPETTGSMDSSPGVLGFAAL